MFAEQKFLPGKSHCQPMFHIMIKHVRIGDALQRHAPDPRDDIRIIRFFTAKIGGVSFLKTLGKGADCYFCYI